MLCKLVFLASLAVGVFGRTVFNSQYEPYDPYDEYSTIVATEYCKATNADDKVPEVKASIKTFAKCVMEMVDTEAIIRDIEEAKDVGVYDTVVKKYCTKSPQLKDCVRGLINGVSPCLPAGVLRTAEKSTFALVNFLCDNDGARIISFVKEDGPQCVQQKQLEISFCQRDIQSNLTKVANLHGGEGAAAALFVPEQERCSIQGNGLECLANALKGCSNKTPGKLAQELHDIYLKTMSCTDETYEEVGYGSTTSVAEAEYSSTTSVAEAVNIALQAITSSSDTGKAIEFLMKRKLELEVRNAELEIWNRENELHVKHTSLTTDVNKQ